jgi:hypothetical protein
MGARLAGKMALVTVSTSNLGRAIPAASVAEVASMKRPAISQSRSSEQQGEYYSSQPSFPLSQSSYFCPLGMVAPSSDSAPFLPPPAW